MLADKLSIKVTKAMLFRRFWIRYQRLLPQTKVTQNYKRIRNVRCRRERMESSLASNCFLLAYQKCDVLRRGFRSPRAHPCAPAQEGTHQRRAACQKEHGRNLPIRRYPCQSLPWPQQLPSTTQASYVCESFG